MLQQTSYQVSLRPPDKQEIPKLCYSQTWCLAHETGRMGIPKGAKLKRLLSAYGVQLNTFYERLHSFSDPKDQKMNYLS